MSFQKTLIDGALRAAASLHPELAGLIDLALKYEPQLEQLGPIIKAAAEEGPGAFAAAEEHAPELAAAIRNFAHSLPGTAATSAHAEQALKVNTENVTRDLFHIGRMDPDEEKAWIDRATPANEDSRFGGG